MVAKEPTISPASPTQAKEVPASIQISDPPGATGTTQIIVNVPGNEGKEGVADILNGAAALLWPIVVALIVILFRSELISLARRIRKGSAFGAEAEFAQELGALQEEASKAKEEAGVGVGIASEAQGSDNPDYPPIPQRPSANSISSTVLSEVARSPRLGLMLLSAEIDTLTRRIAASTGHHKSGTLKDALAIWGAQLPTHAAAAYRLFSHVRNRIVHGAKASEEEILSAIDSGLGLYEALASIPLERNRVAHPGVDIFSDSEATKKLDGKGLIIETTHNGSTSLRVFPTTKEHYKLGMELTWEWNMSRVWAEAWYRDPNTQEIKKGWDSAAEFVGRNLDDV
ncbi:MAG: hypothetical protein ING71_16480 [Rhodocyclaceae bacterium]|nr:hypothetical protein [Rhodocyclaceae bacterium]